MNKIEFEEHKEFIPYSGCIPGKWDKFSFDNLDFTGKEKVKEFIISYLENFSISNRDSLMLYPSDWAYKILVALYKEIGSHIPVDAYKFIDWPDYAAKIKGLGYKGEKQVFEDMFGTNFIFIFDLTLSTEDHIKLFTALVDYAYIHGVKTFITSRLTNNEIQILLGNSPLLPIFKKKFAQVRITE